MGKLNYAAYGSNLHPIRLSNRVPSAKLLGKGVLERKVLRFHKRSKDGSAKCNIVVDDTQQVHVAIYEMNVSEKPLLDDAEGVGYGYQVQEVEVVDFGKCFTYIAENSHIDNSLNPYTWYKELVLVGCEYLNLPAYYIDFIRNINAEVDLDEKRHAKYTNMIARAKNK